MPYKIQKHSPFFPQIFISLLYFLSTKFFFLQRWLELKTSSLVNLLLNYCLTTPSTKSNPQLLQTVISRQKRDTTHILTSKKGKIYNKLFFSSRIYTLNKLEPLPSLRFAALILVFGQKMVYLLLQILHFQGVETFESHVFFIQKQSPDVA